MRKARGSLRKNLSNLCANVTPTVHGSSEIYVQNENHFLVPEALVQPLLEALSTNLKLVHDFVPVQTVVFAPAAEEKKQFHLHIRRYNVDQVPTFVEARAGIHHPEWNSLISKKRFRIDSENFESLMKGREMAVSFDMQKLNPGFDFVSLLSRTEHVNALVFEKELSVKEVIQSERQCWAEGDVRVIVEKNEEGATGVEGHDSLRIIVKSPPIEPDWLHGSLNGEGVSRAQSHQFCFGETAVHDFLEDSWA